ncbi:O-methyltransferas-like protein [Byssothecium circinans]|uniref:O-methyltransferas-like protein n=1 Tax=Byssothecium circinans TaxID=147558 RepID=A0A6A5T8M2_9PLEO|nr:O-methyltransferas-like protein [Byssothecium circinans]
MASNGAQQSELLKLAQQVNQLTSSLVSHLSEINAPEPNFSATSPEIPYTDTYKDIRGKLNDAAQDLLLLVNGPRIEACRFACSHNDLGAFQFAFEFDLIHKIPQEGTISLSELASQTGVDEDRLGRILRLLISRRYFAEPEPNHFTQSSLTIVYAQDENIKAAGDYQSDEQFQASSEVAKSFQNGKKSAFEQRHGMSMFEYYKEHPKKGARFASAMKGISKLHRQITEIENGFGWADLKDKKLVDVGGGSGHVSIALARAFPNLNIVVQDSNVAMLDQAQSSQDLSDIKDRMTWSEYDFFTPQPIANAGAYLMRQIIHNWGDDDCVRILQALVPALEKSAPGTPLLINDSIIPAPGSTTRWDEHVIRQVDLLMMFSLGAKQRTEKEFQDLLHRADPRLNIVRVHMGPMALIEVHLSKE